MSTIRKIDAYPIAAARESGNREESRREPRRKRPGAETSRPAAEPAPSEAAPAPPADTVGGQLVDSETVVELLSRPSEPQPKKVHGFHRRKIDGGKLNRRA